MANHLIITAAQATGITGNYGIYSAIDPQPLPDGKYFIPERCISDPDLADALAQLLTMTGDTRPISPLPSEGEWCTADAIYQYDGGVLSGYSDMVICVQSHTRTAFEPWDTPALFTFTRPNSDTLEWISNEWVELGWKRVYSGVTYVVAQAHLTQVGWEPPNAPTLWSEETSGTWAVGIAYSVDDEVSYEGSNYICIQAHTSQAGWEPPNVPALWSLI